MKLWFLSLRSIEVISSLTSSIIASIWHNLIKYSKLSRKYLAILVISLTSLIRIKFAFRSQKLTNVGHWKHNLFHCAISTNNLKEKTGIAHRVVHLDLVPLNVQLGVISCYSTPRCHWFSSVVNHYKAPHWSYSLPRFVLCVWHSIPERCHL